MINLSVLKMCREGSGWILRSKSFPERFKRCLKIIKFIINFSGRPCEKKIEKNIAVIVGENQRRLFSRSEFNGCLTPYYFFAGRGGDNCLIKIDYFSSFCHLLLIILFLFSGRNRFLLFYFYLLDKVILKNINDRFVDLENFLCFNDQPFYMASIVNALNLKNKARTIVFQHGLVLSQNFYFPVNCQFFWAWGSDSLSGKWARENKDIFSIKGRYVDDADKLKIKTDLIIDSALIAPSFKFKEIFDLLNKVRDLRFRGERRGVKFFYKLHPSTKFRFLIIIWINLKYSFLKCVDYDMEDASEIFDAIITKNSTSVLDFVLQGKPAFILDKNEFFGFGGYFPEIDCFYDYEHFKYIDGYKKFLKETINV